jgi:hypothetical protein
MVLLDGFDEGKRGALVMMIVDWMIVVMMKVLLMGTVLLPRKHNSLFWGSGVATWG